MKKLVYTSVMSIAIIISVANQSILKVKTMADVN